MEPGLAREGAVTPNSKYCGRNERMSLKDYPQSTCSKRQSRLEIDEWSELPGIRFLRRAAAGPKESAINQLARQSALFDRQDDSVDKCPVRSSEGFESDGELLPQVDLSPLARPRVGLLRSQ